MSLSVTLSVSRCVKNTTTPATLTISGAVRDQFAEELGWIYSNNTAVELSLDGTSFTDEVMPADNGTYTLYIQAGDIETSEPVIMYEFYDGTTWVESSFDIDFVPDGPVVEKQFESIGLSLSPRQSTIQFSGSSVNVPVNLRSRITGSLLDYNYNFNVERVAKRGDIYSFNGATEVEKLINSLFTYSVQFTWENLNLTRPKLTDHLAALSRAMGITITLIGSDFYPKSDLNVLYYKGINLYEEFTGSFSDHLNRLIGWSDTCPSLVYNVWYANNTLYIIQRGHEQNSYTPANWVADPTLTYTIRRTEWSNSASQTITPEIVSSDNVNNNEPFSGTIQFGSSELVYVDGYLTTETIDDKTTTYTYTDLSDGKYLSKKQTVDTEADTFIVTEYHYEDTGVQKFLYEERTDEYDGQDITGTLTKSTITKYSPIGNGWYGVVVYDATSAVEPMEEVSNSLTQGTPGQKANQYMIQESNDALKPDNAQRVVKVPLRGVAKARQSYPVANKDAFAGGIGLSSIANCLDTYEGKTEITLNGSIAGGTHLYNYNDTITYNNDTYYLVSNNVTLTGSTVRQDITAVRWVLS